MPADPYSYAILAVIDAAKALGDKTMQDKTEHAQSTPHDSSDKTANQDSSSTPDSTQSKPRESSVTAIRPLTGKQMHFARCLAQGMSKTESYIEAYEASNMARKTINEAACRLSQDSRVTARVQQLLLLKEKALIRSTVGLKTQVLTKLVGFMDNATPQDSAKLRAAELLGKSIGLFKDVIEDNRHQDKSPEELTAILKAKLSELGQKNTDTHH